MSPRGGRHAGVWKYSYGESPYVVFAMERKERGGQVFVRWTNPGKTGAHRRDRKALSIKVRDPQTGRLDPKLVRAAELAVQQFQAKLLIAEPAESKERPTHTAPPASRVTTERAPNDLKLRAGFELVLDPTRSQYGSNRTRRYDQMVKYEGRLFGGPKCPRRLIDPDTTWVSFVPAEARALWRKLADLHLASGGTEFGVRAAEGIIDSIYSVAAWLRAEQRIPADAARPPDEWRKALKDEWAQRAGGARGWPDHSGRPPFPPARAIARAASVAWAECYLNAAIPCRERMLPMWDRRIVLYARDRQTHASGVLGTAPPRGCGQDSAAGLAFAPATNSRTPTRFSRL